MMAAGPVARCACNLIGPSNAAWGRGPDDYGRAADVTPDGETTATRSDPTLGAREALPQRRFHGIHSAAEAAGNPAGGAELSFWK